MSRAAPIRLSRLALQLRRAAAATHPGPQALRQALAHRSPAVVAAAAAPRTASAAFSTGARLASPIPEEALKTAVAAEITQEEYHQLADEYLDNILNALEAEQDKSPHIDVEYSAGVMTVRTPDGAWVINKQPPNKQIWLSSPVSGPKRFDWVVVSEDQSSKQDTAKKGWIYLRDGAYLNELLSRELKIKADVPSQDEQ